MVRAREKLLILDNKHELAACSPAHFERMVDVEGLMFETRAELFNVQRYGRRFYTERDF